MLTLMGLHGKGGSLLEELFDDYGRVSLDQNQMSAATGLKLLGHVQPIQQFQDGECWIIG